MIRLLCFIALSISGVVTAQVPDYFVDNPEWLEDRICYDGQGTAQEWGYVYYLDGDTTINGQVWQVMYKRGSYYSSGLGGSGGYTYNDRINFIRQDSLKMYTLENGTSEMLLYDFSLNVGDTLPWTPYHWSLTTVIDSIQMITINGTQRKKMFVSDANYNIVQGYLVEGVGTHRGLFEAAYNTLNCGNQLICFRVNNVVEIGSNCNFSVSVDELMQDDQIKIHPNPTSALVTIEAPEAYSIQRAFLITSGGKKKSLTPEDIDSSTTTFDLRSESEGIYMVEVHLNNGQILRKKLVKI